MALMGNLRKLLGGGNHDPSADPSKDATPSELAAGTQAHKLAEAIRADRSEAPKKVTGSRESPLVDVEVKSPLQQQVTPEDIRRASAELTTRIDALKQQFAFQTGHFDEINQRLVRLEDAIREAGETDPMLEHLTEVTAALQAGQDRAHETLRQQIKLLADATNHVNGRLAEVQQNQGRGVDQLREVNASIVSLRQSNQSMTEAHAESAALIDQRIEQLVLRETTINDDLAKMRRLVLIAAIGGGLAAVLSLIALLV